MSESDGPGRPERSSCATVRDRLGHLATRAAAELPRHVVPSHFRKAAVILLVGCRDDRPYLVLSERAANLRAHASEVCLPGGHVEPHESEEDAAVREAVEELSVDAGLVQVSGRLDQAWSHAGSVVTPVVAWYSGSPTALRPNGDEVARVLVADLIGIAEPSARRAHVVSRGGRSFTNDVLVADDFEIYGLTADIVLDLLAWVTGSDRRRVPERAEDLAFLFGAEPEASRSPTAANQDRPGR